MSAARPGRPVGCCFVMAGHHCTPRVFPLIEARSRLLELERLFEGAKPQAASEARQHLDELARIIHHAWDS
jgi:hypothetical protein